MQLKGWFRFMNYDLYVSITTLDQMGNLTNVKYVVPIEYIKNGSLSSCKHVFLSLPLVIRNKDHEFLTKLILQSLNMTNVEGIFCHNIEGYSLLLSLSYSKKIIGGPNLYIWNKSAKEVLSSLDLFVSPYELSNYEIKDLGDSNMILPIFGKTPLMITANCVHKSTIGCTKQQNVLFDSIKDRKNVSLPVSFQCNYCYNVIYNAIPTSLHDEIAKEKIHASSYILFFADESKDMTNKIISYFMDLLNKKISACPFDSYTKAYYSHGVD